MKATVCKCFNVKYVLCISLGYESCEKSRHLKSHEKTLVMKFIIIMTSLQAKVEETLTSEGLK